MNVLVLTLWYPRPESPGSGTYVREQCRALRDQGVDVRVIQPIPMAPLPVRLWKHSYRQFARVPERETVDDIRIYHPRYLTLPRHALFEYVGDWLFRASEPLVRRLHADSPIDIIHAHTTYPCGYAANLLRDRLLPDVRVVHTIHRTCVVDVPRYSAASKARVRTALLAADRNVFVSLEGQRLADGYTDGRVTRQSAYITNGVNQQQFTLSPADREAVGTLKAEYVDSWNLLFVGTIEARKGIPELLVAIAQLARSGRRRLRLFLVGSNLMGSYVRTFAKAHGIDPMVVHVGPVPHDAVTRWMHFADALVLPAHSEGMPTVLFEALFCGLPGIYTRVGGVTDLVDDGVHALVIAPGSVQALVDSIVRVMDHPTLARELGTRGREKVSEFTWQENAAEYIRVFEALLRSR